MRCWGAGTFGQLGYENPINVGDGLGSAYGGDMVKLMPPPAINLGGPATQVDQQRSETTKPKVPIEQICFHRGVSHTRSRFVGWHGRTQESKLQTRT